MSFKVTRSTGTYGTDGTKVHRLLTFEEEGRRPSTFAACQPTKSTGKCRVNGRPVTCDACKK